MKGERISVIGIIPQYPNHSRYNVYSRVKMPPVGIVSVFSQLDDFGFKRLYIIDENNYKGPRDFTGMPDHNFLQQREPAKIAMFYGGMSNSIPRMFSLAKQYKKFGAVTMTGGSHVDALPEEALKSGIDIVVHGEGEYTTQEILERIVENGEISLDYNKLKDVKGISILDKNSKYLFTGERKPIKNLDELVDVDLDLVKFLEKRWTAIPVSRGRGCNFKCRFCSVNGLYGRYKASSPEKTLRQIIKYSEKGYRDFFITDDNFAYNIGKAVELCKMIGDYKKKSKKKIELTVQVRSEVGEKDKLIEAMRYAGVTTLAIGYESPINEELIAMKKEVTVEQYIERSKKLSEHFYLLGMFIFSYPTFKNSEYKLSLTLEQKAKEYIKFFKKANIDIIQVLNAIPVPGTGLRDDLEAEGRIFPLDMVGWDKYDGLFLCYDPTPEGLDPYELQEIPRMLMKKWYLGNFINRNLNYKNWMTWVYNTFGFPIQFGAFYTKRFAHNLVEKRREESIEERLLPRRNIFYESLVNAWKDIGKKWGNLAVKTYGGGIARKWLKAYKESDYLEKIEEYFSKKN